MFVDNGFTWQDHLDHSNKDISTQNFTQKYLSKPPKRTNSLPPQKFSYSYSIFTGKNNFSNKKILTFVGKTKFLYSRGKVKALNFGCVLSTALLFFSC